MPQSYSPVYFPQDWSANSMGSSNVVVDSCSDSTTAEVIIAASLDPLKAINQGTAATYTQNNLAVSGNSAHTTVKTNIITDGASKYVFEVTVVKHDTNIKIGCILSTDSVSGSEQLGTHASNGQGWSFVADGGSGNFSQYRGENMVTSMSTLADGDVYHIEFNNATGEVFVWRKAVGGSFVAQNSGNSVVNDTGSNNGQTALAGAKVHLAGHLYQTAGTNLMLFNFSGPFDKPATSGFVPFTKTITGVGNSATWNPNTKTGGTLSEGNTKFAVSGDQACLSTLFAHTSGKYFAEATLSRGDTVFFGVKPSNAQTITTAGAPGAYSEQHNLYFAYFKIDNLGGAIFSPETADRIADQGTGDSRYSVSSGDTVGCLLNLDDYNVRWYKLTDGAWVQLQKTGAANATVALYPTGQSWTFMARGITDNNGGDIVDANFGQRPFSATPPENAVPLSTQNLPAPTVTPSEFFQVLDHTHDGSSTTFTLNWDPTVHDTMLMFKDQDDNSTPWYYSQTLHLGLQYPKRLPNISGGTNYMIAGNSQDTNLLSVSGTTITLGSTLPASDYAIYCWRFGKISDRASNSAGGGIDVASTSSVASHGGAGLCHYVGVSGASNSVAKVITHGMGSSGINWFVHENWQAANSPIYLHFERQHTDGTDRRDRYSMYTNNGNAANDQLGYLFGGGSWPTGATLSCGSQLITDGASQNQVLWMFNEVAGFIKIGVYKGTGSTSGQNVNTGFAPALIIIRRSDSANGWVLRDNLRSPRNPSDENLGWHQDSAEDASGGDIDFLANGFRPVENEATVNASGGVYEYIAFASQPFGGAGVPQSKAK